MGKKLLIYGRKLMVYILLCTLFTLAISGQGINRTDNDEKIEDIKQLLILLGYEAIMESYIKQSAVINAMDLDLVENFTCDYDATELTNLYIPFFNDNFTYDEIRTLIQFYDSPLGRKMVNLTSESTTEFIEISKQWGNIITKRLEEYTEK